MLMHHAHPRRQSTARIAGRQGVAKHLHRPGISHVMAKQNIHQGGLARTIFAQQSHHFTARYVQTDGVIGNQRAEPFGNPVKAQNHVLRLGFGWRHDDLGSVSSIATVNDPSMIAAVFAATSALAASGTLPSKVP